MLENITLNESNVTASIDAYIHHCLFGYNGVFKCGQQLKCEIINNNLLKIYDGLFINQGRFYRIAPGSYEEIKLENGVVGSHAKGSNSDSIGICFEGSYMTETMNQTQINAGRELVAYLKNKYGISKVQKHKDVCSTNCPGTNFPFNEIVNGTVAPTPTPSPTPAAKPSTSGKATGTYEVTASDLSVRTGPGTNYRRKRHDELTADGKKHDKDKDGCLERGTRVTVYEWKNGWARTPSGWLSGDYLRKV